MKKNIMIISAFALLLAGSYLYAADGDMIVNGKLGVGISNPGAKLDISGDAAIGSGQRMKIFNIERSIANSAGNGAYANLGYIDNNNYSPITFEILLTTNGAGGGTQRYILNLSYANQQNDNTWRIAAPANTELWPNNNITYLEVKNDGSDLWFRVRRAVNSQYDHIYKVLFLVSAYTNNTSFVESTLTGSDTGTLSTSLWSTPLIMNHSSGNVGIGTAPNNKLHIYSSDADTVGTTKIEQAGTGDSSLQFLLTGTTAMAVGIDNSDNDKFKFSRSSLGLGNGDQLVIDTSGNVGIGTSNPGNKLDVQGGALIATNNSQDFIVSDSDTPASNVIWYDQTDTAGNNVLYLGSAGSTRSDGADVIVRNDLSTLGNLAVTGKISGSSAAISSNLTVTGNVGIGTTGPRSKLEVANATDPLLIVSDGGGTSAKETFMRYLTTSDVGEIGAYQEPGTPKNLILQRLGGNVGIGTTSPGTYGKLELKQTANSNVGGIGIRNSADSGTMRLWVDSSNKSYVESGAGGVNPLILNSSVAAGTGGVVIGYTEPGVYKLFVNGDGYAVSGWYASDSRFKKNVKQLSSSLDKVLNLSGVSYEWKMDEYKDKGFTEGRHLGVIAQEIEKILPEVVKENTDGTKAVAYMQIIPVLIEAMKEQQKQINRLEQRVSQLEKSAQ